MIQYVIFDFDGTLVDSKDAAVAVFNKMADKHNFKKLEHQEIEYLKTLSVKERCKYLNVPMYKIPLWAGDFYALYKEAFDQIALFEGMKEILEKLEQRGYKIAIISSNSAENIQAFLERNNIYCISEIVSSNNILGKDKSIAEFLRSHQLSKEQVIYVGDEDRDVTACKKNGVKVICVEWGLDSIELVKKNNPDYIIFSPDEILHVVENTTGV